MGTVIRYEKIKGNNSLWRIVERECDKHGISKSIRTVLYEESLSRENVKKLYTVLNSMMVCWPW